MLIKSLRGICELLRREQFIRWVLIGGVLSVIAIFARVYHLNDTGELGRPLIQFAPTAGAIGFSAWPAAAYLAASAPRARQRF
jgi:hypothetical protein